MTAARSASRMPALFLGHGSPMNAIEETPYRRGWRRAAERLPRPRAVLCVSAHWETRGVAVTASPRPETIHDFYGFPPELHRLRYPAPGDPALARRAAELAAPVPVHPDPARGLDHGAWAVLCAMYPNADVPVVELGLDTSLPGRDHARLARSLAPLRDEGILVLGSGNLVHNLAAVDFHLDEGYPWAERFDREVAGRILARDLEALADPASLGGDARLAVPTPEHYLPLLYPLAMAGDADDVVLFNRGTTLGSLSMTSFAIGAGGALDGGNPRG
jgi:4,5-DOPA dioxygenase extradiol